MRRTPWLVGVVLHLLGLVLYLDWREIVSNPPVADTDFATHWSRVWTVAHFLDRGRLCGYDPFFMAGHPEGTLFDVDNKLFEVASWLVSHAGLSLPASYNLVLVATILLAPLTIYPAACWLGCSRRDAAVAQVAALCLWYCDPSFRWAWQGGTFAFAAIVAPALLVVAAAARLTGSTSASSALPWVLWLVMGPALFWLHFGAFLLLVVPLTTLALSRWRGMRSSGRLAVLLWPPLVILINLPWILPAVRFSWAFTNTTRYLRGGLPALAADLFGIGSVDGASHVTLLGLRWFVLVVGGVGLWRLGRTSQAMRAVAIAAWMGVLLAYGLVHLPGGENLTPYRFIQQAALWSTIGLGAGLANLPAWLHADGPARRRGLVFATFIVLLLWVGGAACRFRPAPLGGPAEHRWQGPPTEVQSLCRHLRGLPAGGRVLVDDFRVGALLPWCSGREVIGGPFPYIWTQYGYSNANLTELLATPYGQLDETAWQRAVDTYNIEWIVSRRWGRLDWYSLADWLADHPGHFMAGPAFGAYRLHRVIASRPSVSVRAEYGRIEVSNAPSSAFVLPYHWLPGLRAEPGAVKIGPETVGTDPVPFVRAESGGLSDFTMLDATQCR